MSNKKRKFKPREDRFISFIRENAARTNHWIGTRLKADAHTIAWHRAELGLPEQPRYREDYRHRGWTADSGRAPCLQCEHNPPQDDDNGMKDVCALRCIARVEWAREAR